MPIDIVVPELSESVVEATVSEWLKNEGDAVENGEVIVVLETDKVSLEVTAEGSGKLASIKQQVDADVKPGDVLGVIEGEASAKSESSTTKEPEKEPEGTNEPVAEANGQASESSEQSEKEAETVKVATPVAQRMAKENNVDISKISSKDDGGKITKADVESFISKQNQQPSLRSTPDEKPATQALIDFGDRREERIRMSRRRRTIAERLIEAQQTAAMLTTFNEIDMGAVVELRNKRKTAFKEKYGVSLGFNSFFVKASIGALKAFPRINGEIDGNEIVLKHYYDIGIAIGSEEGLVVPVLRNADKLSFVEIEEQIKDYALAVREGKLSIEALMGGTFTITNGGVFGSMMSTPILNPPQVGILGLHGIEERPVVRDGEIVIRPMMYVALTYDHRMVDGREAVQFLVKVKELIEDPETLLIEG